GRLGRIGPGRRGRGRVEGVGFSAGYGPRWLRARAAPPPRGRAPGDPDGYAALDQLASAVPPGSRGLVAELARADAWTLAGWHPPFRPQPPGSEPPAGPGARAAATGDADGLGARARAIEEAAAYSARRSADPL